jgi:hypothetical protein
VRKYLAQLVVQHFCELAEERMKLHRMKFRFNKAKKGEHTDDSLDVDVWEEWNAQFPIEDEDFKIERPDRHEILYRVTVKKYKLSLIMGMTWNPLDGYDNSNMEYALSDPDFSKRHLVLLRFWPLLVPLTKYLKLY